MKYIILITICFYISIVKAQEPTSDAVFEKIIKEYTLNEDGSMDFHYYKKLKLLTHFSFNRLYGETFIIYNPQYQELTINKSFTTQENGNVVQTPDNAFNEVLPRFAANAPYYNHLREMVVTHTGLELNATIELDYTIHTKQGYYPALMGNEQITESSPVAEEIIIINIPAAKNLNYKVFNIRTAPEIKEEKGMKIYKFTFHGIGERPHESFQPEYGANFPRLVFSTATMEEAYQFITDQGAFNFKTDKKMSEAITKIKEDDKNDLMVALKLQELVVNDINYYNIPPQYTSFQARQAIETWNSNGGTQFEKSILLVSLLREAGINAEPVMVMPSVFYDKKTGCLQLIRDFRVQANPKESEQLYLSPTSISDQNLVFGMENMAVFALNPDKPLRRENIEKPDNKVSLKGKLISDDSLKCSGKLEAVLFHQANPYFKLKEDSAYAKKVLSGGLSSKDVKEFSLENCAQTRSIIKYDIENEKPLKNQANYYFFEIPACSKGTQSWHLNYLNAERETPLEIPFTINESYEFTITLPQGVKLIQQVEKIERQADFGKLFIEIVQNNNEVKIKRSFEISEKTIPVSSYKKFKEMMDLWNEKKFRELVLKK